MYRSYHYYEITNNRFKHCAIPKESLSGLKKMYYLYFMKSLDPIEIIDEVVKIVIKNHKGLFFDDPSSYVNVFYSSNQKIIKKNLIIRSPYPNPNLKLLSIMFHDDDPYMIPQITEGTKEEILINRLQKDALKAEGSIIIPSIITNMITANKLVYYDFLSYHGIIQNAIVVDDTWKDTIPTKGKVFIKTPYSSRNDCVMMMMDKGKEKNELSFPSSSCYTKDGIIIHQENKSASSFEISCHTIHGKAMYYVIKERGSKGSKDKEMKGHTGKRYLLDKDFNWIITHDDDPMSFPFGSYINLINDRIHEFEALLYDTYILMNKLGVMSLSKYKDELNEWIKKPHMKHLSKEDRKIFMTPLMYGHKIKILKGLLNGGLSDETHEINKHIEYLMSYYTYPIPCDNTLFDAYYRMDVMIPDNKLFHSFTINEVEPFSCYKGPKKDVNYFNILSLPLPHDKDMEMMNANIPLLIKQSIITYGCNDNHWKNLNTIRYNNRKR